MNAILEPAPRETSRPQARVVNDACQRIPPLWSLKNFVAVNPFVGLADRHFVQSARIIQRVGHGEMLMPASFYREQIALGRIREKDLQNALAIAEKTLPGDLAAKMNFPDLAALQNALNDLAETGDSHRVMTFADFFDAENQTGWAAFVVEEISKWCSAYFDQGQSSWRMPWRQSGLFAAWKAAARLDANPELMGLAKFRSFAAALPDDHWELIDRALGKLAVPETMQADFLHRQLMSVSGWSGYVQCLVRQNGLNGRADDSLGQLLAIRLVYDLVLLHQFGNDGKTFRNWREQLASAADDGGEIPSGLLARFVAQQALECGRQHEWIAKLKKHPPKPVSPGQKTLQAIFCIDVRSEVFRRALEAQSEEVATIGFAGFFGMAFEYLKFGQAVGGAQCPVLLAPKFRVREALRNAADEPPLLRRMNFRQTVNDAWNAFKTSAISCFSFVETAGLWFGVKLAKDALALAPAESARGDGRRSRFVPKIEREACGVEKHGCVAETGIALGDQIALAVSALKNMGLTSDFARVVLLCGHGSATVNNPYGSALDCGACGGHAGDANARVAAAMLNQPAVRQGLLRQGIEIPDETIFVAGLHNTTTDEVMIFDDEKLSPRQSAELERIRGWLNQASGRARRERAASLGLGGTPEAELDDRVFTRSRDWSQLRPEWGLAGNAAFIAAPRARTKDSNFGGRTFLHDYHAHLDADKSTLELILTAPTVVASWINLQYYGSTVDNRLFGSGNKVLHNVVGTFGVWQGNGGDLQSGLPLQSLHDGARWMHEPLRLTVFVEADCSDLEKILQRHQAVCELVQNGWIHLFALEPAGNRVWRYVDDRFLPEPE